MRPRYRPPAFFVLFALIGITAPAQAQTTTNWTNTGAGDWTVPGNWDNGVPTSAAIANIENGGTVQISAPGQTVGYWNIGDAGTGAALIQNGGTLTQASATATRLGNGSLTITGGGSSLSIANDLEIGRGIGASTIIVSNGGQLSTGRSYIGEGSAPTTVTAITATVTGAGSLWDAGGFVGVGNPVGTASLTISAGGKVTAQDTVAISSVGYGGEGTALVTDPGSQLILGGTTQLAIGEYLGGGPANGTLTIQNGGLVVAQTVTMGAFGASATGTLNINGTPGAQGVLQTTQLARDQGSASVSFDGGILRASADSTAFISGFNPGDIVIQSGGMYVDSNGFAIIAVSGLTGTGGLIKQGAGSLSLTGANTYAGGTAVQAGTLAIGNGSTAGSIQGNVTIDGGATLAFNRSDAASFAGAISGGGALLQQGASSTTLTGTNTYTGGTTIQAGSLAIGNGGTAGSILGNVVINTGTNIAFNRIDAVTFAGAISGGGVLLQQGTGSTALTGTNTYTGGTTVQAGTLAIGNGGTAGSIEGNAATAAGSTLAFDRSDTVTFAGTLSGTGTLLQEGGGTLVLTASNSQGSTVVQSGTLSIASPANLGPGALALLNGTTIAFTGSGNFGEVTTVTGDPTFQVADSQNVTFTSAIGGTGDLVKTGTGTLILDGANNYAGPTTVAAGTLIIGDAATPRGRIASAAMVSSGATLAGYGTVGGALANAGQVVPGGPTAGIGTLHVGGNYSQSAGGTLAINVSPAAASQLQVAGASSLAGTVAFSYAAGTYSTGIYPILTGAGGVSGQFGRITESGAVPQTLLRSVLYKPDEVDLVLSLPTVAQASGSSVFTDATGTAQHNTQAVTAFLLDRDTARCTANTQNICVWADAAGHYATFDGLASASGFNASTGGLMIGAHRPIADGIVLGIGAGYDHSDIDAGIAHAGFGTARVFLYGDIDLAPAVLSGTAGYAHDWFSSHRNGSANYLTAIGTASQSHDASEYSAGLQLGLPTLIDAFQINPRIGLQYADIDEAGFYEQGAGPLNLTGDNYTHDGLRSFIRLDVSRQVNIDNITLVPRLSAGYARELLPTGATVALVAAGDIAHADNPFTSRDIVTTGAGIDLSAWEDLRVSIDYDANFYTGNGLDQVLRLEGRLAL